MESNEPKVAKAKKAVARVEIPKITFEAYLREHTVHPGLVASFSSEEKRAGNSLGEDDNRTSEEWKKALETQSNRRYL